MEIVSLDYADLRFKTYEKIKRYMALSDNNCLTIGLYSKGRLYVFGNIEEENRLRYDIGSVSKTVTAHLILKLYEEGKLDITKTVDNYLPLKKGKYPTVYQLLTHTAGYHHLTPVEVTLPRLVLHSYMHKNPYENRTVETVIKALERRRFFKTPVRYGYSDFTAAILAAVAEKVEQKPFATVFEEFIRRDLGLLNTDIMRTDSEPIPPAAKGRKIIHFWAWKRNNPYIAGGGIVSNIEDVLRYVSLQIESQRPYISSAHTVCEGSEIRNDNHLMCIG